MKIMRNDVRGEGEVRGRRRGEEVATRERTRRSRAERAREWGVENR